MKENKLVAWVVAALLCAIGIVIPMFCPKIIIGPASFTLASHVPIFIAMYISPPVAAVVSLGTTLGFFIAGFPIVIVLRALSHIIFVLVGALWLKKQPQLLTTMKSALAFGFVTALIHAASELLIVTWFYFGGQLSKLNYSNGYVVSVLLLVGLGGFVHSMVDYGISAVVWRPLVKTVRFPVSVKSIVRRQTTSSVVY